MKARDLKSRLSRLGYRDTGRGTKHEKWSNGIYTVSVPRHKEIAEGTARSILKEAVEYGQERQTR